MGALNADPMAAFVAQESVVAPYEFRSLAGDDLKAMEALFAAQARKQAAVQTSGRGGKARVGDGLKADDLFEHIGKEAEERARKAGFEQGVQEGHRAGRAEAEAELRATVAQERAKVATAVREFLAARGRYFAGVEQEVVKLALAIAGRVLHREAQLDPLLLSAAVRVALDKMQDRSGVVLRVAGADVKAWEDAFATCEPEERPRVMEDAQMQRGDCVLETKMGTVELGVSVQLEEIEKGFFDLLNHKPVE